MGEPELVRAFVNGAGVRVRPPATLLDAVRAADPALADAVARGERAVADSRGLVVDPMTALHGGAVLRIVSPRAPRADDPSAGGPGTAS